MSVPSTADNFSLTRPISLFSSICYLCLENRDDDVWPSSFGLPLAVRMTCHHPEDHHGNTAFAESCTPCCACHDGWEVSEAWVTLVGVAFLALVCWA